MHAQAYNENKILHKGGQVWLYELS